MKQPEHLDHSIGLNGNSPYKEKMSTVDVLKACLEKLTRIINKPYTENKDLSTEPALNFTHWDFSPYSCLSNSVGEIYR